MNFKSKSELKSLVVKNYGEDFIKKSKSIPASEMTIREHIATTILSSMLVNNFPDLKNDNVIGCQIACNLADELMLTIAATDKEHEDQAND